MSILPNQAATTTYSVEASKPGHHRAKLLRRICLLATTALVDTKSAYLGGGLLGAIPFRLSRMTNSLNGAGVSAGFVVSTIGAARRNVSWRRYALLGSSALVGIALTANLAAAQSISPAGGGTVSTTGGTISGGGANQGVAVQQSGAGGVTVTSVNINNTGNTPAADGLRVTGAGGRGVGLNIAGTSTITSQSGDGISLNGVNENIAFDVSSGQTLNVIGLNGLRLSSPNGSLFLGGTGTVGDIIATARTAGSGTGVLIELGGNTGGSLGRVSASGFATGIGATGNGLGLTTEGGSITATGTGISLNSSSNIILNSQSAIVAPTGINAAAANGASVTTSGDGTINSTAAGTGTGVIVTSSSGANNVVVTVGAAIGGATGFSTGVNASTTGSSTGTVNVTTTAAVKSSGTSTTQYGIFSSRTGAAANGTISVGADVTGGQGVYVSGGYNISVAAGATVTGVANGSASPFSTAYGVYTNSTLGSLTNAGTIRATGTNGVGFLNAGGIMTTNGSGATISGTMFGIYNLNSGTLTNAGEISSSGGTAYRAAGGTLTNSGAISGVAGVSAESNRLTLTNNAGGTITATTGAGVLVNTGSSLASNFTNAGTITGGSGNHGINVVGGALSFTNQSGGAISGGLGALNLANTNSSTITLASGSTTTGDILSSNAGVRTLTVAGLLTGNYAGSTGTGVVDFTLASTGSMQGATFGSADDIFTFQGGTIGGVVNAGGGTNDIFNSVLGAGNSASLSLSNLTGFEAYNHLSGTLTLSGSRASGPGWNVTSGASVTLSGALNVTSGTGTAFSINGNTSGSVVQILASGSVTGFAGFFFNGAPPATFNNAGLVSVSSVALQTNGPTALTNTGTLASSGNVAISTGFSAASLINSGTVSGGASSFGISSQFAGMSITNQASGFISGGTGGILGGNGSSGGLLTISNASGAGITGATAISTTGTAGIALNNTGQIIGSTEAINAGGASAVSITNNVGGVIATGTLASAGATFVAGGTGDAIVLGSAATLTNAGIITGANRGVVNSSTLAVRNTGTISGGTNDGITALGNLTAVNARGSTIQSAAFSGIAVGNAATATVHNGGALIGGGNATFGYGFQSNTTGASTLHNYGSVSASQGGILSVNSGAVNAVLYAGSTTGSITLGAANDTLTLYNGTGTAGTGATYNTATGLVEASTTSDATRLLLQNAGTLAAATIGAINLGGGTNTLALRGTGDGTAANGAAGSLSIASPVGVSVLTKADSGTWTLSGAANSPGITINAGTGGTPGSGGLLIFDGTTGLTGAINVNGGTIRANTAGAFGAATINAIDPTIQYAASGTFANPIVLQSVDPAGDPTTLQTFGTGITATLIGAITQFGGAAQPLVFSSVDANGLQNTGTFVLTNSANNYAGLTTINTGTTVVQRNTASALGTGGVTIAAGGVLQFDNQSGAVRFIEGGAYSGAGTIRFTGNAGSVTALGNGGNGNTVFSLSQGGSIDVVSGTVNGSSAGQGFFTNNQGSLTIAAGAIFDGVEGTIIVDALNGAGTLRGGFFNSGSTTVGIAGGSGTFSGAITNSTNANSPLNLIKAGAGTQILTGTNSYTGSTTVTGGTLEIRNGAAIADSGAVNVQSPGIFAVTNAETIGNLLGSGTTTLAGNLTLASASGNYDGTVSGAGALILSAGNKNITGALSNTGGLQLTGTSSAVITETGSAASTVAAVTLAGTGNSLTNAGQLQGIGTSGTAIRATGSGATIGNTGFVVGTGNAITAALTASVVNSGTIGVGVVTNGAYVRGAIGTNDQGTAIRLNGGGSVTNNTGGIITGSSDTVFTGSRAQAGVLSAAGLTLDNSGMITGGVWGVLTFTTANITNRLGGAITGATNNAIYAGAGAGSSITNGGTLTGGNAGIFSDGTGLTVNNTGTIRQIGAPDAAFNSVSSGIYASAAGAIITNDGLIESTLSGGRGINFVNGGTINNSGTISAATAILATGSATSIVNSGTITGTNAITLSGNFNDTVTLNSGSFVTGRIDLGGGNDALNYNGGTFAGVIDGGTGADIFTVALGSSNNAVINQANAINFEEYRLNSGTLTLTGNRAGQGAGWTVNAGTINVTGSLTDVGINSIGNSTAGIVAAGNDVIVNIAAGAVVWAPGQNAIQQSLVNNLTVVNAGQLGGGVTGFAGIRLNRSANITNQNGGLITSSSDNINAMGLSNSGAGVLVTNEAGATITGNFAGIDNVMGIEATTPGLTVTNSGTITSFGAGSYGIRSSAGTIAVTNATGGVIGGVAGAILINGGTAMVDLQTGSITNGSIDAGSSTAASSFIIGGALNGGLTAGLGNDTVSFDTTGGSVSGMLSGGAGTDSLTITGSGIATLANTVTGFESLTKNGTGTLTLSGTNGAFGAVAINTGTLNLSGGSSLGDNDAVTVAVGGILDIQAFDETIGNLTLSGTLNGTSTLSAASYSLTGAAVNANLGAGILTQTGGVSTLNGTAAASQVTVSGGTLTLGAADRLSDTATVSIDQGAVLDLGAFAETVGTAAIAGTLNGTGTLSASQYQLGGATINANLGLGALFQQRGTSILNGRANTSVVAVNAGTLRLGAANRIADNAAVNVAQGAMFDLAGNSETVGLLTGSGGVSLGSATLSVGGTNANFGFNGTVSGSGDLVKTGTGVFSLLGSQSLTGRIIVNAGDLLFAGTSAGGARVQGGTLSGAGTFAGNLALASGTLSPGIAGTQLAGFTVGTLTATGGVYAIDFAGSAGGFGADLIRVAGAATLTGATVAPNALGASGTFAMMHSYTVLQAGSLTGTFANGTNFTAVGNNPDLQYRLRYDLSPNSVILEIRKQIDFATGLVAGASANQLAVAAALNGSAFAASDSFAASLNAIAELDADARGRALDSIGGEAIADVTTIAGMASNRFIDLLQSRLATGSGLESRDTGGAELAISGKHSGGILAMLAPVASAAGVGTDRQTGGVWLQADGAYGTIKGRAGQADLGTYAAGIAGGFDAHFGAVTLGIAGSVSEVEGTVRALASRDEGTIYQGGAYLAYDDGATYGSVIGSYFAGDIDVTRRVSIGALAAGQTSGTAHTHGFGLGAAIGQRIELGGGMRFTPQASGQFTQLTRDAFTETGGGSLSLATAKEQRDMYQVDLEGRFSHIANTASGTIEPYISAGVQLNAGDRGAVSGVQLTGAPVGTGAFTVEGARLDTVQALLSGGLNANPSDNVMIGVGVDSILGKHREEARIQMHVRIGF